MYYGDKKTSKVKIADELMRHGWDIYGYKQDDSDMMTDYFDPANWQGIATKNGYVLCVDIGEYDVKNYSGKAYYEYNNNDYKVNSNSNSIQEKIQKLSAMTRANGAAEGEERNAQEAIRKINMQVDSMNILREQNKTLKYKYPEFQCNPGRSNWHVERDGEIIDKGTGAFQFYLLPWDYDVFTEKFGNETWIDGRKKKLSESESNIANKFKTFIQRVEKNVSMPTTVGDGTAETEYAGINAEKNRGYKKVTVKETKTKPTMVQVERDYIQVGDYITLPHRGHYWHVTSEYKQSGVWQGRKQERKVFVFESVGAASRGFQQLKTPQQFYDYEDSLLHKTNSGATKIFELKEVTDVTEKEKWIKKGA